MLTLREIRHIHVELTTKCNARCPMCMRNYRGGDFNSGYPVTELSLSQFKQIVTTEVLKILRSPLPREDGFQPHWFGTSGVSFNGNLGDFAAASQALDIVSYIRSHDIPVSINTNGSLRPAGWWAELGATGARVGFALDGLADTHHLHRQDTNWHTIIRNAKAFIAAGGHAVWRFVPFAQNQHQESQCRQLAEELGFRQFENIHDGRDKGPVFHRDGAFSHHLGTLLPTESAEPPPWRDLLENHITWYSKDSVRDPRDTAALDMHCIHKINREIYLAADGSVYPCCFLGFYPQTMTHPGNNELRTIVQGNNALEVGLEQAMAWFDKVEETWKRGSIAQGRTYQCVVTCNRMSESNQ